MEGPQLKQFCTTPILNISLGYDHKAVLFGHIHETKYYLAFAFIDDNGLKRETSLGGQAVKYLAKGLPITLAGISIHYKEGKELLVDFIQEQM